MRGFLLIDKPAGITSHDVINIARRSLKVRRIGHAGTLDPFATGLLLLGIGNATRLFQYLGLTPKVYEGTIQFGIATDTQDPDGQVTEIKDFDFLTLHKIRDMSKAFIGRGSQLPPLYSAVKVRGKPLYKLARKGNSIELKERTIHVDNFEIISYESPHAKFILTCSEGTYVRMIAHDLGLRLGTVAHLNQLRRISIGPFCIEDSVTPDRISESYIMPIERVIEKFMQSIIIEDVMCAAIQSGQKILATSSFDHEHVALFNTREKLVAIAHLKEGYWYPKCVLTAESL